PSEIKEKNGEINIYNASGKLVRTLYVKDRTSSMWDGRDLNGAAVSSGIYYFQLKVHGQMLKTGSMILLK
ncbi:MAG: FlgD immunoglobulin-like domain containing protein, partial [Syntrophothermus sp.]